jgi:hypothetical protein
MTTHFHIRWSAAGLDWEPFRTRDQAWASAKQLARPNETYVTQEYDETCPQCQNLLGMTSPINRHSDKKTDKEFEVTLRAVKKHMAKPRMTKPARAWRQKR